MPNSTRPYDHLNQRLYEHFLSGNALGNFVHLPVDDDFIQETAAEIEKTSEQFLQSIARTLAEDWSPLIELPQPAVPRYLGLIAIQLYAAWLMDDKNKYSEKAYRPWLSQLLEIDQHQLQSLLARWQDVIWHSFRAWCSSIGFQLDLPEKRKGPHRYTQYPLSQAFLNNKDLKRLGFVFDYVGLRAGESLFFEDFMYLLYYSDKHPHVTPHYLRVKKRAMAKDQQVAFYRQIFDYYNQWDGSLPEADQLDTETYDFRTHPGGDFFLSIEEPWCELIITDSFDCVIDRQSLQDAQALHQLHQRYRVLRNEMLFFIPSSDYDGIWEYQRFLEREANCLLIAPRTRRVQEILRDLPYADLFPDHPHFHFIRFRIIEGWPLNEALESAFFRSSPVKPNGGLKLGRTQWLYGAGPLLTFQQTDYYYLNGQKLFFQKGDQFSCANFLPDRYVIKHKDHSPVSFTIKEAAEQEIPPAPSIGWKLDRSLGCWDPAEIHFAVFGFYFPCLLTPRSVQPVREWIEAHRSKKRQTHLVQTIHAINRSLHGI